MRNYLKLACVLAALVGLGVQAPVSVAAGTKTAEQKVAKRRLPKIGGAACHPVGRQEGGR